MNMKLQKQLEEILKAAIAPAAERLAALETRLRKVEEGKVAASAENRVKLDRPIAAILASAGIDPEASGPLSNSEINKALKDLSITERMEAKAALQRIGLMSPGRPLQDAGY